MNNTRTDTSSDLQYARARTGVYGLDDVLHGGLHQGQIYLIEGDPGAGKTTLGMQFLINGAQQGERALYLSLAESRAELQQVANSHGFDLTGVDVQEVHPPDLATAPEQQYTVFHPSEVELADVMQTVINCIKEFAPKRLVIDSMSEFRMLARDPLRYRRQVLSLKQFLIGRGCTSLILDERMRDSLETQLQTIAHGVIRLENIGREYGIKRRRLEVVKVRASKFREGFHDYIVDRGGMRVFPRLVSGEHTPKLDDRGSLPSGIAELDQLFRGGVARGTSTLIIGPSGAGKSTISSKFVVSAAERNEAAAIFTFDEVRQTYLDRS
ncbi:MAG TPA: ATPase domain-containing protein, partial [Terriglobales bacterium]